MENNELTPIRCTDCPFHRIDCDPDPDDWFCDYTVAIFCKKAKTYVSRHDDPDRFENISIPNWCPLKQNKK